jgi:hypothetical protein
LILARSPLKRPSRFAKRRHSARCVADANSDEDSSDEESDKDYDILSEKKEHVHTKKGPKKISSGKKLLEKKLFKKKEQNS